MITRQELEKMVEEFAIECAMKRHKGLNEVEVIPTGTYCGAKSGASFVMDKLMPEIEKLKNNNAIKEDEKVQFIRISEVQRVISKAEEK